MYTDDDILQLLAVTDGSGPLDNRRSLLRVWVLLSGEEYPRLSYSELLISWDWATVCVWEKVRPMLYGGEPIGEKLLSRLLNDVEGEVRFDGERMRPLALLPKELGVCGPHEEAPDEQ